MPNNLVFNHTPDQLLTQIYGTDGNSIYPVKTDSSGRIEVSGTFTAISSPKVLELKSDLENVTGTGTALTVTTSGLSLYSFYVYNLGTNLFKVRLQVAPQNQDSYFIDDQSSEFIIDPVTSPKALLVPKHYLKFTRLVYDAGTSNISAEVWFIGRS